MNKSIAINNRTTVSKTEAIKTFLFGSILGMILFICLYGIKILNFTYIDWLYMSGGDISQHQIGWEAFRNSVWHFPLGLHDQLSFPYKISVIYTDSIPLFAVIFKCFSGCLPTNFQYIGFFGLMCFSLQGGFSALLIRKFINNKFVCLIGSVLFTYNSVLIYRMFAHTALAAQWLILAAWCLFVYKIDIQSNKRIILFFSILLSLAPCIHMYYVPMLGIMLLFFAIYCFYENKDWKNSLAIFVIPCICCLVIMYVLGVFYGGVDIVGGPIDCTMNMNSFINPIPLDHSEHSSRTSLFLKELPRDIWQCEGGCYLGLGVIISLITCFCLNIYKCFKEKSESSYIKNHPLRFFIILTCSLLYILSLGLTAKLGNTAVINIWYPQFVIKILSIFRAVGRFIWPVYYMIILYVIVKFREIFKSNKKFILVVCLTVFVNLIDHSGMLIDYHNYFKQEFQNQTHLLNEKWGHIKNKNIVFSSNFESGEFLVFGKTLIKNGNSINNFYFARSPHQKIVEHHNKVLKDLQKGLLDKDTICIFKELDDISWISKDQFEFLNLDGYTLVYNKN